jgi:hypothetical protein
MPTLAGGESEDVSHRVYWEHSQRTSQNSVKAKFAEYLFHVLG